MRLNAPENTAPPARTRLRRLTRALVAVAALDLFLVGLYLGWAALILPAPLPASTHTAGVVFFAGFGSREGLDAKSMERVEHAANLFRAGKVELLVCVGGRRRDRPETGATIMAAALIHRGVPATLVRHDTTSFDTISNWRSAQVLLGDKAHEDPLLVSAPLHLLRIRHITGGAGTPAPTMTIAQTLRLRGSSLLLDVHREWLAWTAAALLPANLHHRWIRHWRNFWDNLRLGTSAPKQPHSG
jgi:vancomycin permeability regulator SanA